MERRRLSNAKEVWVSMLLMTSNRRVACKHWNVSEILNERDITFGVLGGQQKCIEIYVKMAMPPFKLRATPQLYDMCYLSRSSVKLESLATTWNLESGESSVSFSRNSDFSSMCLLSTSEISGRGR